MEFKQKDWLGKWTNFENFIYSEEAAIKQCWQEAEGLANMMPMFKDGVKAFWEKGCDTVSEENNIRIGGWNIEESKHCMKIEWLDVNGELLGKYDYKLCMIVPKGLEANENFLFEAVDAPEGCPFTYVLAMEPMPSREAKLNGGLLSHLHFQYASKIELLLQEDKLSKPMWYPTMCDGESTLLERCNIVRALHRLPVWEKLPK